MIFVWRILNFYCNKMVFWRENTIIYINSNSVKCCVICCYREHCFVGYKFLYHEITDKSDARVWYVIKFLINRCLVLL